MKRKVLTLTAGLMARVSMTLAMVLTLGTAMAQEGWQTLELGKHTPEANIFGVNADYVFTPTESGVLTVWSQDQIMHVYTALNAEGTDVDYATQISQFAYASYTDNGVTFSKKTTSDVEAGKTYYLCSGKGFSKDKVFLALMETGISELTLLNSSQPVGEIYNITDSRDGQVELEFNLPATADNWATLTIGTHTTDSIETRADVNTGKLIFELKDSLYSWLQQGFYQGGEEMTLTVTGVRVKTNADIVYGTDGKLVLTWKAPSAPHYHLSTTGADPFLSYWVPGDEKGIVTLEFDYDLMTIENGQTAAVVMQIGSADMGDAYSERLDPSNISVDGKKLYVDFTGKRRAYEDMGLTQKWGSISIKVYDILMADGTMSFNENSGNYGSVSFGRTFEEYKSDIAAEFTPADGSTLTEPQFKVYFSDKKAYTFKGVVFDYQTLDDIRYQAEVYDGIVSEEIGESGIEYTIPVPEDVKAGKNIRVSFADAVSADGFPHDFNVKYNPGPELVGDLQPASVSVKDNSVVPSLDKLVLTFAEPVTLASTDGFLPVMVTDLTTNQTVDAGIALDEADSKKVVITPAEPLNDTHKYEIYVNYYVVVNSEYVSTKGKYGRYMPGFSLYVTISSLYDQYDFATDPIVGSTVSQLDVVTCTTKPGTDSYSNAISPTRCEDRQVYVVDAQGETVTNCTVGDDIMDGFTITLDQPITTSGQYTIVIPDSVYNKGEGYGVETQSTTVRLTYNVLSAPKPVIYVAASDPVSESKVESLSTIMVTFSEWVYGDDCSVMVMNKATYATYNATMTINPKNRTMAMITLEEEITDEGTYTIVIPEGRVGDQAWYESGALTGNMNETSILYFTIGGNAGGDEFFTTDPANNSTVESLSHIKITFDSETGLGGGMITVKKDGEQIARVDAQYDDDFFNVTDFHIYFDATEEGVYTFEVPEGYFLDASGNARPAFTLTYTIGNGQQESSDWTTDPEDGSNVESLHEIHVWNTTVSEMACGSGKVVVKRDGVELETIADASWGNDMNELIITTSTTYTENGTYTFEVPEGFFTDENGNALPAVTFTYYIGGTGINGFAATEGKVTVYSADGKCLLKNADSNMLKALRGLYIVNGKKSVLK